MLGHLCCSVHLEVMQWHCKFHIIASPAVTVTHPSWLVTYMPCISTPLYLCSCSQKIWIANCYLYTACKAQEESSIACLQSCCCPASSCFCAKYGAKIPHRYLVGHASLSLNAGHVIVASVCPVMLHSASSGHLHLAKQKVVGRDSFNANYERQQDYHGSMAAWHREIMDAMWVPAKYSKAYLASFFYIFVLTLPHSISVQLAYPDANLNNGDPSFSCPVVPIHSIHKLCLRTQFDTTDDNML